MGHDLWFLWASLAMPLLYYYYLLTTRSGGTNKRRLPPGPRPLPLIGNLLHLRGNLHHALARLAQSYGPVVHLRLGLSTAVIVVSSREATREAFTKHDRRLAARSIPDAARALGLSETSVLWLPSSDPKWKTLRGVMASRVTSPRGHHAATRGVREGKVRDLVRYFRACAGRREEVVDLGRAVFGGLLNLVSGAFFSVDVVEIGADASSSSAHDHGLHEHIEGLLGAIMKPNVSDLFPPLKRLDLQGRRREVSGHLDKVFRVLDGIVERQLLDEDKPGDLLDALLDLMHAGKIDRDTVRTFMFDLFVAGSDTTTASTVSWAMAELLRNPDAMAKACEEITGAYGGKEAIEEPEAACQLPYLRAVVKEAMRLHPVAPLLLPHKAVEDGVKIGGYVVPGGSTVLFNAGAVMRDPTSWEERPEEFVPERFLDFSKGGNKEFDFLPFGTGRRQCPGMPMAECVVPHVLASLLHAFEWSLPDDGVLA